MFMMTPERSLVEAASLAKWLIDTKKKPKKVAYIIAANKYKLGLKGRSMVSKEYQLIKDISPGQESLL